MEQVDLLDRVVTYNPLVDKSRLELAYDFARKSHGTQTRASGEPYITHPLQVADILAELKLDEDTIIAALLHDTIEDTPATREEIDKLFGESVGALVEGVTKLGKLNLVSKKAEQAENFRKLLIAISSDVRVLLIKMADRLHNMRTLEFVQPSTRKRISEETMDIYAPLAGRMGMQWLRDELEEHSFRWLNEEAYFTLTAKLAELREKNKGLIEKIEGDLRRKLADNDFDAEVFHREKRPYSIWRKMDHKQISLEQLSDIYGFRVIVNSVDNCYRVLGLVHTIWRAVPGRFKDYISNPKQNDYRSIHTSIVGARIQRVELQIRTQEMHRVAEYGIAAHALYKDETLNLGLESNMASSSAYQWLRRLVDQLLEGDNPEEFLEHTRLELFHDQVFCFTPQGLLIALPSGACAVDFAYAVHTDIGNLCVGAKINRRNMPLRTELRNGDEVFILTSEAQTPQPSWERFVITGKARSSIRRATKEARRKQYLDIGVMVLERAFQRAGKVYSRAKMDGALPRFTQETVDEVIVAVGRGELPSNDVVCAVFPDISSEAMTRRKNGRGGRLTGPEEGWINFAKVVGLKFRLLPQSQQEPDPLISLPVRGQKDGVAVDYSVGGALPGDRIVGIIMPGEGINIYPIQSPLLEDFDDELDRWIDVTWDIDENDQTRFMARISISAVNEPGCLAQIAQLIGESNGNIDTIRMTEKGFDYSEMLIGLEVWDLKHLNAIIAGLKTLAVVSKVERVLA
ncbi:MAG: GTP pyrophosphokinase [Rhodomicrobium sp.]|nr:MAG: GTP pyrophosphokinase [Rhodomicrobium sp.]